jgi:hypothetical protein
MAMSKTAKRKARRQRRKDSRMLTASVTGPQVTMTGEEPVEIVAAGDGDDEPKLASFAMVAYTGGRMRPMGFTRDVVVALSGLTGHETRRPILLNHDPSQIVGHADSIDLTAQRIKASGIISGAGVAADQVVASGSNGFPWRASIGASIDKMVFVDSGESTIVNGRKFTGPLNVVTKARLREISFVPIAADDRTTASVAASAILSKEVDVMEYGAWLEAKGFVQDDLTDAQNATLRAAFEAEGSVDGPLPQGSTAAPLTSTASAGGRGEVEAGGDSNPVDPHGVLARREAHAVESGRISRITEVCAEYGSPAITQGDEQSSLEAHAIANGWTVERTELEALRASRPTGPAIHSQDSMTGVTPAAIEASLCIAAGLPEAVASRDVSERDMNAAVSPRLRGTTLHALMDFCVVAAGAAYSGSRKSNEFIHAAMRANRQLWGQQTYTSLQASAGFSTVSLSGLLGNVANKALVAAYEAIETVNEFITATRSHSDFKSWSRYRLDNTGAFQKVGPDGELKHVGLDESTFTNQLDTYGAMISLTRQMIINDDLGAFLQIPTLIGRMSAIKVEEEVFKLLLSNPSSFFAAGNGNTLTGAASALDIEALGDGEQLMLDQVDSNAKPILVAPRILLVGSALKVMADDLFAETRVEVSTTAAAARRFANNPHRGKYTPYVSPYINNTAILDSDGTAISGQSATRWYMFSDPVVRAAMAVATLNGQRLPVIESQDTEFSTLGLQWRGYHDFGVGMEDTVGAIMSDGA